MQKLGILMKKERKKIEEASDTRIAHQKKAPSFTQDQWHHD